MSARIHDSNGWYRVDRNPISRVGVFPYLGRSIGVTGEDADKVFQVYRPAEELGSADAIESFRTVPVISDHTMLGAVDLGLTPAARKGVGGTTGDNVEFDAASGILYSNIKIFDEGLAGEINAGKKELSCGYRCAYDFTPGEFNGQKYDVVQRRMRGNHVAVVKKGRMGSDIAVLDSQFTYDSVDVLELKPVLDKETQDAIAATVKAALDGLDIKTTVNAAVADAMPAALKEAIAAKKDDDDDDEEGEDKKAKKAAKATDAQAALDAANARIDELTKQIAGQPKALDAKDVMATVADRDALYQRVKPFVGVFEHGAMDASELAVYACDKLGLKAAEGAERAALDGFLHNRTVARTVTSGLDAAPTDGKTAALAAFAPASA